MAIKFCSWGERDGGSLSWADGEVVMTCASGAGEDTVPGQFLDFLARDMASHPERLQAVDAEIGQRARSLVDGVAVDLDAALSAEDD